MAVGGENLGPTAAVGCKLSLQRAIACIICSPQAAPKGRLAIKARSMANLIQIGARKLPTMLGMGILGVSLVGIIAAAIGAPFTLAAELVSAAAGMAVGSRYA